MNPLYLSRIGISNFRTFGEDFEIDLPEQPGLTVLCGMNGLGKTAFFDAIEWALLGSIQRLSNERMRKPEGNPLTREGATPGSHRVELSWGSDQNIIRTENRAPSAIQLIDFLKDPNWTPQIHDLSVYLRLTHFLPQATRERFLEREGKEQWSLLQGPAGVERLERQRKLLDDGKARKAFDRCIASLEKQKKEAADRIEDWKKLLTEQDRWSNVAAAAAEISPEALQMILQELEFVVPLNQTKFTSDDPILRLAAMRASAEANSTSLQDGHRHLDQLESSARRYAELIQRIRALQEGALPRPVRGRPDHRPPRRRSPSDHRLADGVLAVVPGRGRGHPRHLPGVGHRLCALQPAGPWLSNRQDPKNRRFGPRRLAPARPALPGGELGAQPGHRAAPRSPGPSEALQTGATGVGVGPGAGRRGGPNPRNQAPHLP